MLCTGICATFGLCLLDNFMHGYLCSLSFSSRPNAFICWVGYGLNWIWVKKLLTVVDWIGLGEEIVGLDWILKMDPCTTLALHRHHQKAFSTVNHTSDGANNYIMLLTYFHRHSASGDYALHMVHAIYHNRNPTQLPFGSFWIWSTPNLMGSSHSSNS